MRPAGITECRSVGDVPVNASGRYTVNPIVSHPGKVFHGIVVIHRVISRVIPMIFDGGKLIAILVQENIESGILRSTGAA
jgi:hypothetical protein